MPDDGLDMEKATFLSRECLSMSFVTIKSPTLSTKLSFTLLMIFYYYHLSLLLLMRFSHVLSTNI